MREIQAENMVASLDSILIMAGEQDKPISLCDLLDGMEITKKIIEDVKSEINNMTEWVSECFPTQKQVIYAWQDSESK